MTEIAFLLDLVLNHKMSAEAKKRCIERIGEVEAKLSAAPPRPAPSMMGQVFGPSLTQAPSTLAALERQGVTVESTILQGAANQAMLPVRTPLIKTEVVTSTTSGGSTRGPRKF